MRRLTLLIVSCLTTSFTLAQVVIYSEPYALGPHINSPYHESNVVISPDGKIIYFTRENHPLNVGGRSDNGDVWASELTGEGKWTAASSLGTQLNDSGHNRMLGFMGQGEAMLLHSPKGIAFAYHDEGKWLKPTEIEIPYFKAESDHLSGCISADGRYLVFAMESYGSYGVEDLYMCELQEDESWSSPKNLGSIVNTSFQEVTPFLAADNKTLFFSTNGRGGEGSFDIFVAQREDDTWLNWTTPVNLGSKVNTKGQELSFVFGEEADYAYLISTQNSDGYGDLKRVKIKADIVREDADALPQQLREAADHAPELRAEAAASPVEFNAIILDKKTKKPIVGAEVQLLSEPEGTRYEARANTKGQVALALTPSLGFDMKVHAWQYLTLKHRVTMEDVNDHEPDVFYLEPLLKGNTIGLSHVLFRQGEALMVPGSAEELDLVLEMLLLYPDIKIFLSGHTDNRGQAALNLKLSRDRVETVKQYLVSKGIAAERISGQGFGGTRPIASNDNAMGRKKNRRVEFTIE